MAQNLLISTDSRIHGLLKFFTVLNKQNLQSGIIIIILCIIITYKSTRIVIIQK